MKRVWSRLFSNSLHCSDVPDDLSLPVCHPQPVPADDRDLLCCLSSCGSTSCSYWTGESRIISSRDTTQKWKFLVLIRTSILATENYIWGLSTSYPSKGPSFSLLGPEFSLLGPALLLLGPALLLPDLHYFSVTFPTREIKQTERNYPNRPIDHVDHAWITNVLHHLTLLW